MKIDILLPQTSAPRLVRDNDGLNAPFRAPGDAPAPKWFDAIRQPVPAAVLALLIGAVVIFFLPATRQEDKPATVATSPVAPAPAAAPVAFIAAPTASTPAAAAPAAPPVTPVAIPSAVAPAPAPAETPATPMAAAPAQGLVVIRARAESWVEVVDAKGNVAVRKIMAPGESAGANGALPLAVTVGRADATDVEVRGKKFDLRPVAKDNVARFEVK